MVLSTAQYRQKPVSQHDAQARAKYVRDLRRLHGAKMKKGLKVKINVRGKNVEGVLMEDVSPTKTAVKVKYGGKEVLKDLATIYGVEGISEVEESAPPSKLLQLKPRASTPRKLLLEAQAKGGKGRARTPPRTPRKVAEGRPPVKKKKPVVNVSVKGKKGQTKVPVGMVGRNIKSSLAKGKYSVKKKDKDKK